MGKQKKEARERERGRKRKKGRAGEREDGGEKKRSIFTVKCHFNAFDSSNNTIYFSVQCE